MKLKIAALAVVCAVFTLFAQKGNPAQFTLNDLHGASVSLSEYKGQVVVIDFWATWCQGCKEAFPKLNVLVNDFGSRGVSVLGINIDHMKPERIESFAEKANLAYKILLDPKAETVKQFGIKGVPSLAVVGKDGKIEAIFRGINGDTEKDIRALITQLKSPAANCGASSIPKEEDNCSRLLTPKQASGNPQTLGLTQDK